jgi:autotransporter-associated beta strand protein
VIGAGEVGGSITISGTNPTVNSITYGTVLTTSYTITGGTINLANAGTQIGGTNSSTINSVLAGAGNGIVKWGAGFVTLGGNNTYTGATSAQGGRLLLGGPSGSLLSTSGITVSLGGIFSLNNSVDINNNRVGDAAAINMEGGQFWSQVKASSNVSETMGNLGVNSGANLLSVNQATSGFAAKVTYASLSRSAGATMVFSGTSLGVDTRNQIIFTSAPTPVNGIIGGWAVHQTGTTYNWATYDNTLGVQALASYTTTGESTWTSGTDNVQLTGTATLTADRTINSLAFGTGTSVLPGTSGYKLTIGTGGILAASASTMQVGNSPGNSGNVTAGTSGASELIVNNVTTFALTIYARIVDNDGGGKVSLVKSGSGTGLVNLYNATNSYSGDTVVNSGSLLTRAAGAIPSGAGKGNVIVRYGGTLDLFATSQTINGLSGDGNVTNTSAGTSTLTVGSNDTTSTFSGIISDGGASKYVAITKTGTGTLTLSGANTYTRNTTVSAGTLLISGSTSASSAVSVASNARIGGAGTIGGSLSLLNGASFVLSLAGPLTVTGAVTLDNNFSIASLVTSTGGAVDWTSVAEGTYTLIASSSTFSNIQNFGPLHAANIGGGKSAYFQQGSLQLVVVPEPNTCLLFGIGMAFTLLRIRSKNRRNDS